MGEFLFFFLKRRYFRAMKLGIVQYSLIKLEFGYFVF